MGYDGRLSSPELASGLVDGLRASGMEAICIGRGPTPMLYYAATTLKTGGAVMVTGSHNPPDYNGFKMMLARQAVLRRADPQAWAAWRADGDVVAETAAVERNVDVSDDYVARLLARLGRRRPAC